MDGCLAWPAGIPTGNSDTNYAANGVVSHSGSVSFPPFAPLAMAAIPNTASIIMVQESLLRTADASVRPNPRFGAPNQFDNVLNVGNSQLHFDGGNLLFADGHAKWRKRSSLTAREFGLNSDARAPALGTYTAEF